MKRNARYGIDTTICLMCPFKGRLPASPFDRSFDELKVPSMVEGLRAMPGQGRLKTE
jgi:hypothetical protein